MKTNSLNLNKKTSTNEALVTDHAVMLHNLNVAVIAHDTASGIVHTTYTARLACLELLTKAGINDVQSGQNAASKKAIVLPNQLAYAIVKAEEDALFLVAKPDATEAQLKKNLAQKVSTGICSSSIFRCVNLQHRLRAGNTSPFQNW